MQIWLDGVHRFWIWYKQFITRLSTFIGIVLVYLIGFSLGKLFYIFFTKKQKRSWVKFANIDSSLEDMY